jgi:hypothetical protein
MTQLIERHRPRTTKPDVSDLIRRTRTATCVIAPLAGVVCLIRASVPVPDDDTALHRFFPLALCIIGLTMAWVAHSATFAVTGHSGRSWLRWLSLAGLLQTVHALTLGSLSLTLALHHHDFPMPALAWAEDWMFIIADGLMSGVLVLALPVTARVRSWNVVVRVAVAVLALGVVSNMVTPRDLANPSWLANPVGIPALEALAPLGIGCFLAVTLLGLLLAVVRTIVGSFSRDRESRRAARPAMAAALVAVAAFILQAATPENPGIVAAAVVCALSVVTWLAIILLGVRAVALHDRQEVAR